MLPSIYKSSNSVIQNLSTVNCLAFIRITTELFIEKNSVCKCRVKEIKTWEPLYLEVAPKLDFRVYCFFFFFGFQRSDDWVQNTAKFRMFFCALIKIFCASFHFLFLFNFQWF